VIEDPRAIIFDLFGTLVDLSLSSLPHEQVGDRKRVVTIEGLSELLKEARPGLGIEEFYHCLDAASGWVADFKQRNSAELSSAYRFRVALERAGVGRYRNELAVEMSLRHMKSLASSVRFPEARRQALITLAKRYRLGIVSNFDHGPTGRAVLEAWGIDEFVDVALISDEMGVRKPSRAIFEHVCRTLGCRTSESFFVGDSYDADILGAVGAGLTAIWIDSGDQSAHPALARLADVDRLPDFMQSRYGSGVNRPGGAL